MSKLKLDDNGDMETNRQSNTNQKQTPNHTQYNSFLENNWI